MKTFILTVFFVPSLILAQKKPLLPDLLAEQEKVPVITNYRYGASLQYKSGAYSYQGSGLDAHGMRRHLGYTPLSSQEQDQMGQKIATELNKAFATDKFYTTTLEQLETPFECFVPWLITIEYTHLPDNKVGINAIATISFLYQRPDGSRRWSLGPWVTGKAPLFEKADTPFEVSGNPSIEELLEKRPYDPYFELILDGTPSSIAEIHQKIMKQYNKKKKKK